MAPLAGLRRALQPSPAGRRAARLLVVGLGAARLVEGVVEVAAPAPFLGLVGTPGTPAGVHLGFRMKGGRDIGLGLLTLRARRADDRLAELALAAIAVDGADAIAVGLDRGRTLGPPVDPLGVLAGVGTAVASWWAWRQLRA